MEASSLGGHGFAAIVRRDVPSRFAGATPSGAEASSGPPDAGRSRGRGVEEATGLPRAGTPGNPECPSTHTPYSHVDQRSRSVSEPIPYFTFTVVATTVSDRQSQRTDPRTGDPRPLVLAGVLLGFGLGGLLDLVLVHLVVQWHHVASGRIDPSTLEGLRRNLVLDGLLGVALLAVVLVGVAALWRAARRPSASLAGSTLAGSALVGFGAFNALDDLVSHRLLDAHHVHPAYGALSDTALLAASLAVIVAGVALVWRGPG